MNAPHPAMATEEGFQQLMDDMQVIYGMKAGHVVTQADVDSLNRLDSYWREDGERATDAYHRGYQDGLVLSGGADVAKLINERDDARAALVVEQSLGRFLGETGSTRFRDGAAACRETWPASFSRAATRSRRTASERTGILSGAPTPPQSSLRARRNRSQTHGKVHREAPASRPT